MTSVQSEKCLFCFKRKRKNVPLLNADRKYAFKGPGVINLLEKRMVVQHFLHFCPSCQSGTKCTYCSLHCLSFLSLKDTYSPRLLLTGCMLYAAVWLSGPDVVTGFTLTVGTFSDTSINLFMSSQMDRKIRKMAIFTPGVHRHLDACSVVRLRRHEVQITSKFTFVGMCSAVMITDTHLSSKATIYYIDIGLS